MAEGSAHTAVHITLGIVQVALSCVLLYWWRDGWASRWAVWASIIAGVSSCDTNRHARLCGMVSRRQYIYGLNGFVIQFAILDAFLLPVDLSYPDADEYMMVRDFQWPVSTAQVVLAAVQIFCIQATPVPGTGNGDNRGVAGTGARLLTTGSNRSIATRSRANAGGPAAVCHTPTGDLLL